jgi:putative FmdB family regulatory protein
MPLYEYECDVCSHRFEKIQKFSDPLEDTCPKCGGHVHKLMSSPAIQFKGSGFYITDYAKKDHVAAAKADKAEGAASEKSEKAGKSDTSGKSDKGDTSTKTDKSASSGDSGSSSASSAPAASTSSAKDSSKT